VKALTELLVPASDRLVGWTEESLAFAAFGGGFVVG
jgi:hypothetical protein